ncbi:MAG: hypothetical protein PF481_06910 [Bacteroidales bacterium]|jgi:hypothetical protein|nr:hypothetical protein [Bacteroidales bacterium]
MAANILAKIFSSEASDLIDSVGKVVDNVTTTKEEKLQLNNELEKSEQNYQLEMQKLTVEEKQLYYQDVDSARKLGTAVQTSEHASKLAKNVSPILALATTAIAFTLFYFVIFKKDVFDQSVKDIVLYILGVLSAILTQIYSYYFGSSQGSANKHKMIADMQNKI